MQPRNRLGDRPEDEETPNKPPQTAFHMLPLAGPPPPVWETLYAQAMQAARPDHPAGDEARTVRSAIVRLHLEDGGFVEPIPGPQAFVPMLAPQQAPEGAARLYQQAFLQAQESVREDERRRSRARIDRLLGS